MLVSGAFPSVISWGGLKLVAPPWFGPLMGLRKPRRTAELDTVSAVPHDDERKLRKSHRSTWTRGINLVGTQCLISTQS